MNPAEAGVEAPYRPTESESPPAESPLVKEFPRRWRLPCVVIAILHLAWVAAGAAHREPPVDWKIAPWLGLYSKLSGTGTGFGYFSPEIKSEFRGRFVIELDGGKREFDSLETGMSREGLLRARTELGLLGERIPDKEARQQLARYWAAHILARHPQGRRISTVLEEYELPSLVDYPRHPIVGWRPFYRITFATSQERR